MKTYIWDKVPSVMTGGKPFFYNAKDENGRVRYAVVWDRRRLTWTVKNDTGEFICAVSSVKEGQKFVQNTLI